MLRLLILATSLGALVFGGPLLHEPTDESSPAVHSGFCVGKGLVDGKSDSVTGHVAQPSREFGIRQPSFTYVCEDAGAGGYEAFPDVCRLNNGKLMCVFYAGYDHVSLPTAERPLGGRISYCLSNDEGQTWSKAETLYDGPNDDRDPSIVQLKNGRLICNYFSLGRSTETNRPFDGLGTWIVSSEDGGKFWSEPRQISAKYYCSAPIRVLSTGRLILGLYAEDGKDSHGAVMISDDAGQTWGKEIDIDNGGVQLDAETDLIELNDGSLFATQRPQMSYSISTDKGLTWTVSKPIGFEGHCPYFLRTPGNIIVLAFRLPKTNLRYSFDECKTWSENVPIDDVIGAYPSLVNLNDGTVRVVYYEEGTGSNIRSKRFRATSGGIEWLAPAASKTPGIKELHLVD